MSLVPGAGGGDTIPPAPSNVQSITAGDSSIVIGGTATEPTIETGSLNEIVSLHPPVGGLDFNNQQIFAVSNITSDSADITIQAGAPSGFDIDLPYINIVSVGSPPSLVIEPTNVTYTSGYSSAKCVDIITDQTITSGTAFVPSELIDCELSFNVIASVAGSYEVTFGPSTGAEYTITSGTALLAGSDDFFSKRIPAGWKVIVTLTSVTLGNILVQTV